MEERTMAGPLDRLFGNGPFDLNHDGKIDAGETAYINDVVFENNSDIFSESFDEDEELEDEFDMAGLDRDELELMDEDERREALEDAGLDADDFDDF